MEQGNHSVMTHFVLTLYGKKILAWQEKEKRRYASHRLWVFRNKMVAVDGWEAASREEIVTGVKHKVLGEEKAFMKMQEYPNILWYRLTTTQPHLLKFLEQFGLPLNVACSVAASFFERNDVVELYSLLTAASDASPFISTRHTGALRAVQPRKGHDAKDSTSRRPASV